MKKQNAKPLTKPLVPLRIRHSDSAIAPARATNESQNGGLQPVRPDPHHAGRLSESAR